MLTVANHDRDQAGLTYVYPVLSRRSGGLSVGVNLNPNRACNWRCVYCQVPGLVRGAAPPIDLDRLERELDGFLGEVTSGDFCERQLPPGGAREIRDLAISGDGEPTSAAEFGEVVTRIGAVLDRRKLQGRFALVLISNGSLVHRPRVQEGLRRWEKLGGELWFKLDSATDAGLARINGAGCTAEHQWRNLKMASALCPVWVQTCVFRRDGPEWVASERAAYLACLAQAQEAGLGLRGVRLYGMARPSHQPEASELMPVAEEDLDALADGIRALGLTVQVSP